MAATLRELAEAAGVSIATASRAFGHPDRVEETTRQRIVSLAAELDYRPNRAARTLKTGRFDALGLVVPDLTNPFYPGIVKGAQATARAAARSLLIADTDEDPAVEERLVEQLSLRTDAVILCSSRLSDEQVLAAQRRGPVVLVNREVAGVPSVRFDARAGVEQAALHLRALGHQRVAFVAGPRISYSNTVREQALASVFPAHGLELVPIGHHEPWFSGGRAAADQVLLSGATAVMVYNDVMALGLIGRLASYGIEVPRDLSVIGWDDIEFAEMFTPPLTTVRMPREDAGREAVTYLAGLLDGVPNEPEPLRTDLVFRRTTARPSTTPLPTSDAAPASAH